MAVHANIRRRQVFGRVAGEQLGRAMPRPHPQRKRPIGCEARPCLMFRGKLLGAGLPSAPLMLVVGVPLATLCPAINGHDAALLSVMQASR